MVTKISVVIPSVSGLPVIAECLDALSRQRGEIQAEVIVVNRCRNGTAQLIAERFPWVDLVSRGEQEGIPQLRAAGIERARGDIVVVTEDHCIAPDNWFEEIVRAHEAGYTVVGGSVENGCVQRVADWASFLCEYSQVMSPVPSGEVDDIPGNNASYDREVLSGVSEHIKKNCWEYYLHEELRSKGVKFLSSPAIVVTHKKQFGVRFFFAQKFHYSRSFAAMRWTRLTVRARIFYLCATPLLPLLLVWRVSRQVLRKKRLYKELVLSLPLLSLFGVSYACGEFAGYLLGQGQSLVKVE
jgi:GT2 family glycosyltransferase